MKAIPINAIAELLGSETRYSSDDRVAAISSDTRNLPKDCLFIALRGDNFDGNNYVADALANGAKWAVAERMPDDVPAERVLLVPNSRQAYLDIAGLYRSGLNIKVVAVTGSVGKTTTKEMIACVTDAVFPTLKTEQNLNNEVGMSQTILQLEEKHRVAVLEMGMDAPGEIALLSHAARPNIAVITNIGISHIQKLGSKENILREKLEIASGMQNGVLILNGDDAMLGGITENPNAQILRFGIENNNVHVRAVNIKEYSTHTTFEILYNKTRFDAQMPCMGRHNVGNALAAFLVGICLGMEPPIAIAALKNYTPAGMRQKVVSHAGFTVVEDCYNASPDSMHAALSTLAKLHSEGKRLVVLSDMLELGEMERELHREIGDYTARQGIDALLCVGGLAQEYFVGAQSAGMVDAAHYETQRALFSALKEKINPGDIVWFKASRGMKLENIIRWVYEEC